MENLKAKSFKIRKDVLDLIYKAKTGHIGGDFSVCDILMTLYYRQMNISPEKANDPDRDRFVLSKGHSVESLYCILADRGFFPKAELETYSQFKTKYIGHPNNKVNGIEMNSGSLGHGLAVCVGMALAGKMNNRPYRVYTVMGDGELAEGSIYEAAMAAGHYKLDNLTAVIDRNGLQISGTTEQVMSQEDLGLRWQGFGWEVLHAQGNDFDSLNEAFEKAKTIKGKPTLIIAHTTKGYGVSFMENSAPWHHKVPSAEEYEKATAELAAKEAKAHE